MRVQSDTRPDNAEGALLIGPAARDEPGVAAPLSIYQTHVQYGTQIGVAGQDVYKASRCVGLGSQSNELAVPVLASDIHNTVFQIGDAAGDGGVPEQVQHQARDGAGVGCVAPLQHQHPQAAPAVPEENSATGGVEQAPRAHVHRGKHGHCLHVFFSPAAYAAAGAGAGAVVDVANARLSHEHHAPRGDGYEHVRAVVHVCLLPGSFFWRVGAGG